MQGWRCPRAIFNFDFTTKVNRSEVVKGWTSFQIIASNLWRVSNRAFVKVWMDPLGEVEIIQLTCCIILWIDTFEGQNGVFCGKEYLRVYTRADFYLVVAKRPTIKYYMCVYGIIHFVWWYRLLNRCIIPSMRDVIILKSNYFEIKRLNLNFKLVIRNPIAIQRKWDFNTKKRQEVACILNNFNDKSKADWRFKRQKRGRFVIIIDFDLVLIFDKTPPSTS